MKRELYSRSAKDLPCHMVKHGLNPPHKTLSCSSWSWRVGLCWVLGTLLCSLWWHYIFCYSWYWIWLGICAKCMENVTMIVYSTCTCILCVKGQSNTVLDKRKQHPVQSTYNMALFLWKINKHCKWLWSHTFSYNCSDRRIIYCVYWETFVVAVIINYRQICELFSDDIRYFCSGIIEQDWDEYCKTEYFRLHSHLCDFGIFGH